MSYTVEEAERVVDLPDMEEILGDEPGETLVNLYNYLVPEDIDQANVDIRKIRINEEDLSEIISFITKNFSNDEATQISFMWMNQGPAGDYDLPKGKVYLYEGYMTEANQEAV